jgi:adenine deaminase
MGGGFVVSGDGQILAEVALPLTAGIKSSSPSRDEFALSNFLF